MTPGIMLVIGYTILNALIATYKIDKPREPITIGTVVVYLIIWVGLILALVYWK